VSGTLTIGTTTAGVTITNSPVALSGTGYQARVSPTSLNFGNVTTGTISNPGTAQLTLQTGVALTNVSLTFSTGFSRATGGGAGNCSTAATFQLAAGASCTIGVRFTPTTVGQVNGTLTVSATAPAGVIITGSPVSLTGTGVLPALTTLDQFNRAVSTNLGANWAQAVTAGVAAIDIAHTGTGNATGVAFCDNTAATPVCGPNGAAAYWNGGGAGGPVFGNRQAARFVFANASGNSPSDGSGLILKATGGTANNPQNYIRVQWGGGVVSVAATTNGNTANPTFTTVGLVTVFGAGFQLGDAMTAAVDASGLVTVWQTPAGSSTATYLGSVQMPANALWTTGTGRIGMQVAPAVEVDNFAGGNF
jgi:hypothetical protein